MAERRGASRSFGANRERWLSYRERHAGLKVFGCIYWAIYAFVVGAMLVVAGYAALSVTLIAGWSAILFAIFLVIYGFVISLHHKLMRKHG
jgi:hypothetical protein